MIGHFVLASQGLPGHCTFIMDIMSIFDWSFQLFCSENDQCPTVIYISGQGLCSSLAGADKLIRLWELDTKLCVQEYRGHTDVVRDVKVASRDHFFSAANDW